MQSRDKPSLEQYLAEALKYNLVGHDLYKQAVALKKRREEEEACRELMRKALAARDVSALTAASDRLTEMGLGADSTGPA